MNVHLPRFPGHLTLHPLRHRRNPHRRNYACEQRKDSKQKTVVTNASDTFLISKMHFNSTGLKVSHASFSVSPRFYLGNVTINVAQNTKKWDLFRDLLILIVGHVLIWILFLRIPRINAFSWESYVVNIKLHEPSALDFRVTEIVRKLSSSSLVFQTCRCNKELMPPSGRTTALKEVNLGGRVKLSQDGKFNIFWSIYFLTFIAFLFYFALLLHTNQCSRISQ